MTIVSALLGWTESLSGRVQIAPLELAHVILLGWDLLLMQITYILGLNAPTKEPVIARLACASAFLAMKESPASALSAPTTVMSTERVGQKNIWLLKLDAPTPSRGMP